MAEPYVTYIGGVFRPDACGVSHYLRILRERLKEKGIHSQIITSSDATETPADRPVKKPVRDWRLSDIFTLASTLRHQHCDLLHIQFAPGSYRFRRQILLLPLLLRSFGFSRPIVVTLHEYGTWEWHPDFPGAASVEYLRNFGQRRQWWDRETGFLTTASDTVICTNPQTLHLLRERFPDTTQRFIHIPLASNIALSVIERSAARRELLADTGWPENADIVVWFGLIHPVKGLETLLKALYSLIRVRPGVRLLIIGGGGAALSADDNLSYRRRLLDMAAGLRLTACVAFTGYLPEKKVSAYLQAADIGVLPFTYGVNLKSGSLISMLAHGLPVIVTRSDQPQNELENERIVRCVDRRDHAALAAAMEELLNGRALREEYGRNALTFSRKFSWDTIVAEHLAVYHALM